MQLMAIGLNPALQKSLVFPELRVGEVNRATSCLAVPGGKGYHFARAANTLSPGCCTVAHFVGGSTGEFVAHYHDQLKIPQLEVNCRGATRTCTTVLDEATGTMTELIEPSAWIEPDEVAAMQSAIMNALPGVSGVGLCGTFPPGVDDTFYAWVAKNKGGATLLLDGYRGVGPTLETGAVDILKINLDECLALTGCNDAQTAMEACMARFGVLAVALTDGPGQAFLQTDKARWRLRLPVLDKVANPIGAGDTVAGVMLTRLLAADSVVEAFALGLAAATASCLHMEGAHFTLDSMHEFRRQISVEDF